jgi:SAM-dependent methyltransferase
MDLCSGPGDVGRSIRQVYPNARLDFVDRDPVLLCICRGFNQHAGIPGTYRQLDLNDVPWCDELEIGRYDVVAIANSLHWLDEARADPVIDDVHRLLCDGGILLFAEPACPEPLFAPGFDEWKRRQPARYEQKRWQAFWAAVNSLLGYDHTELLGSPRDPHIGDEMTVAGWIGLEKERDFGTVDVLWRDADVVIVAAQKA